MIVGGETEERPANEPRMNILIVDDQPDGLLALEAILGNLGQNLVRASSGREALRLLLREDFALILLDVVMPGMDGFETAALIRERPRTKHTPIIFLTAARKGEGPLTRGYETGAVDFIFKPIDPEVLRSKVKVFVELAIKTEEIRKQAEELREAQAREHERELTSARERLKREQMQREMEAHTAQRRWLEALLDGLPRALLLADPETGKMTFANRAAQPVLRALADETNPLSHPTSEVRRAARGERFEGLVLDWISDGGPCTMLLTGEMLPAMHGQKETVIISALDVTELKRTEGKLQRAVRARDEFMSAASHELNTPLTTIVLQLDSLSRQIKKSGVAEDARSQKTLATLNRNVDRLGRLIAEMLDVSRVAEGRIKLERTQVDLCELAREVASRFEDQLARVGCKLTLEVPNAIVGHWDKSRLDQVVTNLLTNAMKYAPGKPVELRVEGDDKQARLSVKDNGIGIAKESHARIFERFERAVPTENYAGMGLGLWIVSRIVTEMGGTIGVESEPGQGATFTVTLPLAASDAPLVPPIEPAPGSISAGVPPVVAAGLQPPVEARAEVGS